VPAGTEGDAGPGRLNVDRPPDHLTANTIG
jgi:hypothetical protein